MPLFRGSMDQERIRIDMSKQASLPSCLASAFAHLGCDAEAREAAARLLEVDPAFTISSWIARDENATLSTKGLRKTGLPE